MSAHHINPNQLQLLINPTEHIARMQHSTDAYGISSGSGSYGDYDSGGNYNSGYGDYEYHHNAGDNPAPSGTMRKLWKGKEGEAMEPEGEAHGGGMYDLIASGEQIHNPIQINMGHYPDQDIQYEGHHRVAAGHAVQRDTGRPGSVWLPVQYNENYYTKQEREHKEREYNEHIEGIKAQRDRTKDPNRPKRFSGMTSA